MSPSTPIINHYTALISCSDFQNLGKTETIASSIIKRLKLQVVKKVSYVFQPHGETLVWILSQSHLALHTYPEANQIHIDLICCSELSEKDFRETLKLVFKEMVDCEIVTKSCNF